MPGGPLPEEQTPEGQAPADDPGMAFPLYSKELTVLNLNAL